MSFCLLVHTFFSYIKIINQKLLNNWLLTFLFLSKYANIQNIFMGETHFDVDLSEPNLCLFAEKLTQQTHIHILSLMNPHK